MCETKQYLVTVPKMIHQTIIVNAKSAAEALRLADTLPDYDERMDYVGFEVVKTFKAKDASEG